MADAASGAPASGAGGAPGVGSTEETGTTALDPTAAVPTGARSGAGADGLADSGGPRDACLSFDEPVAIGSIEEPALDQLSGLVASRTQPGVLFAHEDSTGDPILYALDTSGRALARYTLPGAPNFDWEDIALGGGPAGPQLFIGDIGDNAVRTGPAARDELQVIRLAEPVVALEQPSGEQTLTEFDVLRFRYPGGVHESETLLVEPVTGDILLVTRASSGDSRVFRASGSTPPDTLTTLEEIGRIAFDPNGQGAIATGGDISPNGDRVIVRTYTRVYLWAAPSGGSLADVFRKAPVVQDFAVEPQGEGITFTPEGTSWLAAGEQEPTLYRAAARCP